MNRRNLFIPTLIAVTVAVAGCAASEADTGREDHRQRGDRHDSSWSLPWREQSGDHARVGGTLDPLYRAECGSCHVAYPPGGLDAASWNRLFDGLEDHFGDHASLAPETTTRLRNYVVEQAGDGPRTVTTVAAAPRLTTTRWFVREHHEVPRGVLADGGGVGLAQCGACHTRADDGSFREREIRLPGLGRWQD